MIKAFVEAWETKKDSVRAAFAAHHPDDYGSIVKTVVTMLAAASEDDYEHPDPKRIHKIDDGDYQGTLVFVVGANGYQPSKYWYVKVGYGSCSGCDTLESVRGYSDETPTETQIADYMTLALHVVQGLKEMQDETI